jgi:hypothetical protein
MKAYRIKYCLNKNYTDFKVFQFETKPTKEECRVWIWNILNRYGKFDWELRFENIEIIYVEEEIFDHYYV